jgi:pimeloyl-ACP methyl ester carboxylesterase
MNGELAVLDEGHAFRLYLARRHVPVWSLDYRTHFVAPDTEGLKFMRGWSSEVFLGDAIEALDFVLEKGKQTGMGKVVVAGFSRGATFAYVLGERRTASVAGLVILDGVAPGALGDMGSRQRDQPAIDIGSRRLPYPKRKVLLEAVVANPKTPSTDPEHPTVGDHLGHILFTSRTFGGRGGLSAAREGRASIRTVAQLLLSYDRYWPTATTGFGDAAALVQRTDRPVFALASTNIGTRFTEAVVSSARAAAGPAATVVVLDGYGHLDVLVGRDVRKRAFEPLVAWLRQFDLRRTPAPAS